MIEITPEMIEAGAVVIEDLYGVVDVASLALRVYQTMEMTRLASGFVKDAQTGSS